MNTNALGTLFETVEEAEDQDGRQLQRFVLFKRKGRRLVQVVALVIALITAPEPDIKAAIALLETLAQDGQEITQAAEDGHRDEQHDVTTHRNWRTQIEALARWLLRKEGRPA